MSTTTSAIRAANDAIHDFENALRVTLHTGSVGEDHTALWNRLTTMAAGLKHMADAQRYLALAIRNVYRDMERS